MYPLEEGLGYAKDHTVPVTLVTGDQHFFRFVLCVRENGVTPSRALSAARQAIRGPRSKS